MSKAKESAGGSQKLRLLLVSDNAEDFTYLQDLLGRAADRRVDARHAASPTQAIRELENNTCDLLLCNYRSGDPMALQLSSAIRKRGGYPPLVFISDHVSESALAGILHGGHGTPFPVPGIGESPALHALDCAIQAHCKERQRKKSEVMLSKLWSAVEQATELIAIMDSSGVVEYINPAFTRATGYTTVELKGNAFSLLEVETEHPETYRQMWETIFAGNVFRGSVTSRKKNGDALLVERTIAPLQDAQGKTTHFVCCDHDVTEKRRLEAQLLQAQKMDAIGRLAGGVAHDFNNLLMVISAYAELMQDSITHENPLRRNVDQILTASRRAADLTRQLLAFSRRQMQSLQVLDLNVLLRDAVRILPRLIGEDIQLQFVPGLEMAKIKCDPVQIEQIVMNLAANARDAMPHGGKLTIETSNVYLDETYLQRHSIVPAADYALMAVTDTGEGILPEHMHHIFEPFYTTKEEGKGTGLGLATVYGIVKQNGGFVWVYSEPGMGTSFKIYWPSAQQKLSKLPPGHIAEENSRGSETVLLVEDEEAVRQSASEFLTTCGYTVLQAINGDDALDVTRDYQNTIDLMITDVVMPHMGGAKLAGQLANARPDMKVLFVSGYAESTVQRYGSIDVTSNFLQKPFSLKVLSRKVREILEAPVTLAMAASAK
jgi:two-component system, cell cycle sensor histidine kinase and response regulator CckA